MTDNTIMALLILTARLLDEGCSSTEEVYDIALVRGWIENEVIGGAKVIDAFHVTPRGFAVAAEYSV